MLRSALFSLCFWPLFALYLVILYPIVFFLNPRSTYKIAYKVVSNFLMWCLKIFAGIKYDIKNIEFLQKALEKGPVIIGCNHQSTWETFIFTKLFDELSIVIKKELLSVPVSGLYFKKLDCIAIDRSSPVKAIKDLLRQGRQSIDKGLSILIFPNGTRASVEDNVEYKGGIYAMYKSFDVPVIPAHVDSGKYWPRRSFMKNPGTIQLVFKHPINPGLSKEEFMEKFAELMNED